MGAGGIINQNDVVRTAVMSPAIYGQLPPQCKAKVDEINKKPLAEWTDDDYAFMVAMLTVARRV